MISLTSTGWAKKLEWTVFESSLLHVPYACLYVQGSLCKDCCVTVCCACCMVAQLYREIRNNNDD